MLDTDVERAPPIKKAHWYATQAEDSLRQGHHAAAGGFHLQASKAFLEAAHQVSDRIAAGALALLANAHARRAEELHVQYGGSAPGATGGPRADGSSRGSPPQTKNLKPPPQVAASPAGDWGRGITGGRPPDGQANAESQAMLMADSIMGGVRRVGNPKSAPNPDPAGLGPCIDDMLELERRLSALGVVNKGQLLAGTHSQRPPPSATHYLSSTLGESFCLLNQLDRSRVMGLDQSGVYAAGSPIMRGGARGGARPPFSQMGPPGGARQTSPAQSPPPPPTVAAPPQSSPPPVGRVPEAPPGSAKDRAGGRRDPSPPSHKPTLIASPAESWIVDGSVAAAVAGEGAQGSELVRLLQCMKRLGDENRDLIRANEESRKVRMQNAALREQMGHFKHQYEEKFSVLKKALEEMRRHHPSQQIPGWSGAPAEGQAAAKVEELQRQVNVLMEEAKRKDQALHKYDQWYQKFKLAKLQHQQQQALQAQQGQRQTPPQARGHHLPPTAPMSSGSGGASRLAANSTPPPRPPPQHPEAADRRPAGHMLSRAANDFGGKAAAARAGSPRV